MRMLLGTLLALVFAVPAIAAEVMMFAAASLSDALTEAVKTCPVATHVEVRFNFGGSGTLARQIEAGAPADLFISADEQRVDRLEHAGLLFVGTRRDLLANQLVVIVNARHPAAVTALPDLAKAAIGRLVIGEPATVPAGTYAQQLLAKAGVWDDVQGRLIRVENVRAVLAVVASGDADAGIVYRTDARISDAVKIAVAVPLADGPRVVYAAAVVRDASQAEAARALLEQLAAPAAQAVFARFGFLQPLR